MKRKQMLPVAGLVAAMLSLSACYYPVAPVQPPVGGGGTDQIGGGGGSDQIGGGGGSDQIGGGHSSPGS